MKRGATQLSSLSQSLRRRYAAWRDDGLRDRIIAECENFIELGLGDSNAAQRLCSTDDNKFWQQLSEVLFAQQLRKHGLSPAHLTAGPDLVFERDGRRVFVEVITPTAAGLPAEWINHVPGSAVDFPHEAILLRWTSAIKEKAEALLGNSARGRIGYASKQIVTKSDAYVIAVNSRLLRGFGGLFDELNGISQFPFAVEATLSVGSLQVTLDRSTLETKEIGHQYRPLIPKPIGAVVPADTFWDRRFGPISAIWAADFDERILIGRGSVIVVHNHNAVSPLDPCLLPAHEEFRAVESAAYFSVSKTDGSIQP